MINYGSELKKIRKGLGIKLEIMARKLNIAKSTLSNYENEAREMTVGFYDKALKEYNNIIDYNDDLPTTTTPIETIINSMNTKINNNKVLVKDGVDMKDRGKLREEILKDGWIERLIWGNSYEYLKNIQTKNGEIIMVTFNTISDSIFLVKDIENQDLYVSVEKFLEYDKDPKYCLEYGEDNEQTLWNEIVYWEDDATLTDDTIFNKETDEYLLDVYRKFVQEV